MPGRRCVHVPLGLVGVSTGTTGPVEFRSPHESDPSLRFPTYAKWSKIAKAEFIPRANSELWPTSVKFRDVPGVPPPEPTLIPTPPTARTAALRLPSRFGSAQATTSTDTTI